ncbi:hypothetical protein RJ640_005204 [Escallonia rubra]|uniref:Transmembrane protein n=1 Tax=Escallonia rubra TaxID=112253 RepID=A0AA88QQA8_9ASTE|nr:hypothetical protein RJ640_005204 [Escallonia rubra]
MDFLTGSSKKSWQPAMTVDTTTSSYWLNWRFLICITWVLISMVFASFLISKYEGPRKSRKENVEAQEESAGVLYDDEVWKPCLKEIHPAWLLVFRVVGFFVLVVLLILNAVVDGGAIFYYYTQWTFTLITIYFGVWRRPSFLKSINGFLYLHFAHGLNFFWQLGSLLSMHGCYQYHNKVGGGRINNDEFDSEQGSYGASAEAQNSNMSNIAKYLGPEETHVRQVAGFWGYLFQIIFQMNAGAVMLTDCVFWFVMVPFLEIKDYDLNFWIVAMHSINAVFLLGDTALNCLPFPWFRIAYFFLWTAVYVVTEWIVHACVSLWWPYPFLDLSSSFAPLWYSSVALLHIPCFGLFALIMKMKRTLLSKWFPQSYRCVR